MVHVDGENTDGCALADWRRCDGGIAWMLAAEGGMVNAFALVPLMWSVALGRDACIT